jgi:transglutaminase-like putative cysteine protease
MYHSIPRWRKVLIWALFLGVVLLQPALGRSGLPSRTGPARQAGPTAEGEKPRSRTFQFTYSATVTGLRPSQVARVWVPVPPVTAEQEVSVLSKDLPGKRLFGRDPTYNNLILYVEAKADEDGKIPLKLVYKVTRREVRTEGKKGIAKKDADKRIKRFLQPDAKVPITGKPLELIKGKKPIADEIREGRVLYDVVNKHMVYAKDTPGWGQGDAVWACGSGRGNCSDFHSLFISLARSRKIPAKFEMGFPLPEKRGAGDIPGYHCWAWFHPKGNGWIPVDISEANKNPKMTDYYFGNLTADRLQLTNGRDITLVPKQAGPPLNCFIYPYVEVEGKPYPAEKVERKFSFKDL